ncbi:MAG: DUF1844 domain-containing protein [Endomicrobium sp.]|jgi:hypothetical protein|nr:DUF1844 domain-containing protein [Endomicrobium sp.]
MKEKNSENKINPYLLNLISMFASSVWCQLGKVPNPVDKKITKDLKSAKLTIDMLIMLKNKMHGNLTSEEEKLLNSTISDLEMNYVNEIK